MWPEVCLGLHNGCNYSRMWVAVRGCADKVSPQKVNCHVTGVSVKEHPGWGAPLPPPYNVKLGVW